MIEKTIRDFLSEKLNPVPVFLEIPSNPPTKFIFVQKTGSRTLEHIVTTTFAIQSYDKSLFDASCLNDTLIDTMIGLLELEEICSISRNTDYPFPDADRKQYRYQAVYEITHY